jgi:hypothetical protein
MDMRRVTWLTIAILSAFAFAGCASGRARDVDCDKKAVPINEHPLVSAQDRTAEPKEKAR